MSHLFFFVIRSLSENDVFNKTKCNRIVEIRQNKFEGFCAGLMYYSRVNEQPEQFMPNNCIAAALHLVV